MKPNQQRRTCGAGAGSDDAGAILVIWTVALVALFTLAALSVDIGNEAQTKQHVVNAAQNAALSAVSWLAAPYSANPPSAGPSCPYWGSGPGSESQAEECAVYFAEYFASLNYPGDNALSAEGPGWTTGCGNAVKDSGGTNYTVTTWAGSVGGPPAADCIGFFTTGGSANYTGLVVGIPSRDVQFVFGPAGGVRGAQVSYLAAASLKTPGSGYVLPFGLVFNGSGGGLSCLEIDTQLCPYPSIVTGPGTNEVLNSPRYLLFPGYSTSSGNNPYLDLNGDLGIDHVLVPDPPTTPLPATGLGTPSNPEVCDAEPTQAGCSAYNNVAPYDNGNTVVNTTGTLSNFGIPTFFQGFSAPCSIGSGTCSLAPRFAHPFGFQATSESQVLADQLPATGAATPCPCLTAADSFGSTAGPLDGVHITSYLTVGQGPADFNACYDYNGPTFSAYPWAGGTPPSDPNPTSQAIDATYTAGSYSGANVWNPTNSEVASSTTPGDPCFAVELNKLAAEAGEQPVFSSKILSDPRFGEVPYIYNSTTGSSGASPIYSFMDVFLYTAYSNQGQTKIKAMATWVFPPSLVEPADVGTGSGFSGYSGGGYVVNLCSLAAGNC